MIWTLPVSSKGQITLPIKIRQELGVVSGRGRIMLQKKGKMFFINTPSETLYDLKGFLASHPLRNVDVNKVLQITRMAKAHYIVKNG